MFSHTKKYFELCSYKYLVPLVAVWFSIVCTNWNSLELLSSGVSARWTVREIPKLFSKAPCRFARTHQQRARVPLALHVPSTWCHVERWLLKEVHQKFFVVLICFSLRMVSIFHRTLNVFLISTSSILPIFMKDLLSHSRV